MIGVHFKYIHIDIKTHIVYGDITRVGVLFFLFFLFFVLFFLFYSSVRSVYFLGLLFLLLTITSIGWPPGNDGVELTAVVPVEGDED